MMTDIPDTHTFKPDYLCDPPCSYKDALGEALQIIKEQGQKQNDEIRRLQSILIAIEEGYGKGKPLPGHVAMQIAAQWRGNDD